jgi:two-component system response regulator HydG
VNVLPWEIIGNPGKPMAAGPNAEGIKSNGEGQPVDLKDAASHAEYETILNVLKQVKFNKTKAAEMLKIDRKTLYNKMRHYEESNNIKQAN